MSPPSHLPDQKFPKAYGEWADGGWGMILTGDWTPFRAPTLPTNIFQGNVQVSETYLGSPGDVAILSKASACPSSTAQDLWKNWAATCQRSGTPTVVQLCHPGRQSPLGAGNRGFFAKTVAPSAVKLNFGDNFIAKAAVSLVFGTPREMDIEEISGDGGVIDQFAAAAKQSFEAGFKGVELHGA
jgi:2,4-dienoyl-CoA reductase-like NADH-dependent reductase (Old Yellow Enzyme family)